MAVITAALLACPRALALVVLNDGHDRIHVTGTVSVSHDSNVFANSDHAGDLVYSSSLSAQYARRAGWIGVNAHVDIATSTFAKFKEEDFANPSLGIDFTKQTGRTTGSLGFSGARESRADAAVNVRSDSWNYNSMLNVKYPIGSTNTVAGSFGYNSRNYVDERLFASLATYSASLDLYHIVSTDREMVGGYRYRYSDTSRNTSSTDHSASLGLSGRLVRGVKGSARVGYQMRIPQGGTVAGGNYSSWTASASSAYALSKKLQLSGSLSKDFSTTATDSSVDVISAGIEATYAYSSRWSFTASAGWSDSQFLDGGGAIAQTAGPGPTLDQRRHDNYVNWAVGLSYTRSEHFKAGFGYSWFQNTSSVPFAAFIRAAWNVNFSSRW